MWTEFFIVVGVWLVLGAIALIPIVALFSGRSKNNADSPNGEHKDENAIYDFDYPRPDGIGFHRQKIDRFRFESLVQGHSNVLMIETATIFKVGDWLRLHVDGKDLPRRNAAFLVKKIAVPRHEIGPKGDQVYFLTLEGPLEIVP